MATSLHIVPNKFKISICYNITRIQFTSISDNKIRIVKYNTSQPEEDGNTYIFNTPCNITSIIKNNCFIVLVNGKSWMVFELLEPDHTYTGLDDIDDMVLNIVDMESDFSVFEGLISKQEYNELDDLLDN